MNSFIGNPIRALPTIDKDIEKDAFTATVGIYIASISIGKLSSARKKETNKETSSKVVMQKVYYVFV